MADLEEDKLREKTKMNNVVKFIKSVRQEAALWNVNHPDYKSNKLKDVIWERLSKRHRLGNCARGAKQEWKKLRDIYRDSLKRRRFKNLLPWKYGVHMAFLIPFMNSRKPEHDLKLNQDDDMAADAISNMDAVDIKEEPLDCDPVLIEASDVINNSAMADDIVETEESLRSFFVSMYDSAKLLPPLHQAQLKRRIFDAVLDSEESYLKTQAAQRIYFDNLNEMENKF